MQWKNIRKGTRNQTFFINDFLPAEMKEQRRREREIFRANELDQSSKIKMTVGRGGLSIEGEQYEKKVKAPEAIKVLSYPDKELNEICAMKVNKGIAIQKENNIFLGHILVTSTHKEINNAYMNLRLLFPQAKHIICAYVIPGLPKCYHEDYCDDGEVGAGNVLLKRMKKSGITNMTIFVIRIQNGPKLGCDRFDLILQAAKNVLECHPFNHINGREQQLDFEHENGLEKDDGFQMVHNAKPARGGGAKYLRGKHYSNRGREGNKRRRQNSPPEQISSAYQWQKKGQNPYQELATSDSEQGDGIDLGGSWPSLHHASNI